MQINVGRPGRDFIGVGVGAVIVRDEKILLLRRIKPPEKGHWTIPGGSVEFGEAIEEAILRELREEIGVEAKVLAFIGVTDYIVPAEEVHWIAARFVVDIVSGEPFNMEPESHDDLEWFPISSLPKQITLIAQQAVSAYTAWPKSSHVSKY